MATETFRQGESIGSFAQRVGSTPAELRALNPQTAFDVGGVVNLPGQPTQQPTGQPTPQPTQTPTGQPQSLPGVQISNEADLQAKRDMLTKAGVSEADFGNFISQPTANDPKLFFREPATFTSPSGEKRTVATGSDEANRLLKAGFTVGAGFDDTNIDSPTLDNAAKIETGTDTATTSANADALAGGISEESKAIEAEIKRLQELLTPQESDLSKDVSSLLGSLEGDIEGLTGRGEAQLSEEDKRQIEEQSLALIDKNTELKKKMAEINALTASFDLENRKIEGLNILTSGIRGKQGQIQREYLARKNLMVSEAGFIQAEALGLQGKLTQAQSAADRAVDLLFDDRQAAFDAKLSKLQILQPQLEKEEARYANAVSLALENRTNELNERRQVMKDYINAGGTDSKVLNSMNSAGSIDEALQILGTNMPSAGGDFQFISGTENQPSGVFDKNTGTFRLSGNVSQQSRTGQTVTDASGKSYDIGTYATDPNHEARIQSILDNMGQMTSVEDMDNYIQSVAPGSEVTGQMIANASEQFGVSWETQMAIMQQDSSFATAGLGARNNNPGNVGQFDSLGTQGVSGYATMQEGVNAVAQNLAGRSVSAETQVDPEVQGYVDLVNSGRMTAPQALDDIGKVGSVERNNLAIALAGAPAARDTLQETIATEKSQQAVSLKTHKGLNSSVGTTALGRIGILDKFTGQKQDFIASVEQLVSGLSLDALIEAKERGATFGALSEGEMQILASSASKIGTWKVTKDGNVTGYNTSQSAFKKELDNINRMLSRGLSPDRQTMPDGTVWEEQSNGDFKQIQ